MAATAPSTPSALKCFLCTKHFEGPKSGSTSKSRSGLETAFLTHTESSLFLTQILGIRTDGQKTTRQDLNRLTIKFQKVCYCPQCLKLFLNVSKLMTDLEKLEEKITKEKNKIVEKLTGSCTTKLTEKTDGPPPPPPGMLQALRNEILEEMNKNISSSSSSVRMRESPAKNWQDQNQDVSEVFKIQRPLESESRSTQTENKNSQNRNASEVFKIQNRSESRSTQTVNKNSQNQNAPEMLKIQNRSESWSTQTENILGDVHCRRRTRKVYSDRRPDKFSRFLNSDDVGMFEEHVVDQDEVNPLTDDYEEIEHFAEKVDTSASTKKSKKSLSGKDKRKSENSLTLDLDSELRNICSQFHVQAKKQMKIEHYICGTCNERFDTFDSLQAHDSLHKISTGENRSKYKSVAKEALSQLDLNSQIVRESSKNSNEDTNNVSNSKIKSKRVSREPVIMSQRTGEPKVLKKMSEDSKQDVQLLEQNPQASKEIPQMRQDSDDTLKQKLKILRQGKAKRHKSLIAGVKRKRTSPFYQPKKCEECGKILSNQDKWKDHVLTIHRGEGKFNCKLCDFTCQFPAKLKSHMIQRHSRARHYECDLCSKAFKTIYNLQQHRKIHVGTAQHECKICSCKFKFAASLTRHQLERVCLIKL